MCIVFLWQRCTSNSVGSKLARKWKFILAANRDEFMHRPSKPADFWKENTNIIGGQDMTAGVEGGTWMAMTRTGRVGFLTNISGVKDPTSITMSGRGVLIPRFLQSNEPAQDHLQVLEQTKEGYDGFNICFGSVDTGMWYTNNVGMQGCKQLEDSLCACVTNDTLGCSWCKATTGTDRFNQIIEGSLGDAEEDPGSVLVSQLRQLLHDGHKYADDPSLTDADSPTRRSVFVHLADWNYGTRTHTVILVDVDDNVTFYEDNLNTDTMADLGSQEWTNKTLHFKLDKQFTSNL